MFQWCSLLISCCRSLWDPPLAASSRTELAVKAYRRAVQDLLPLSILSSLLSICFAHCCCRFTHSSMQRVLLVLFNRSWHNARKWRQASPSHTVIDACMCDLQLPPSTTCCTSSVERIFAVSHLICTCKRPSLRWYYSAVRKWELQSFVVMCFVLVTIR